MLALQTQSKIVPKIMTMADGRVALVHFLVTLENGAVKAKILSVRFQDTKTTVSSSSPLSLCGACEKTGKIISKQSFYESVVSPFNSLSFFVSQPTRAPAFI